MPVEEADESRLAREVVRFGVHEAERGKNRMKRGGPFCVAGLIGMQQVGKFIWFRVTLCVGEERPRLDQGHLRVAFDGGGVKAVDRPDFVSGAVLGFGTGKHLAKDDRHLRIVRLQPGDDEFQVGGGGFGISVVLEIIGAD